MTFVTPESLFSNLFKTKKVIDQAEKNIVGSRAFVNKTTMLNPKLWASRKILMKSIETADDSIQILKLRLNQ